MIIRQHVHQHPEIITSKLIHMESVSLPKLSALRLIGNLGKIASEELEMIMINRLFIIQTCNHICFDASEMSSTTSNLEHRNIFTFTR